MARYFPVLEDTAIPPFGAPVFSRPTRGELARFVRAHTRTNLYDESGVGRKKVAIYCLSDPRDIRDIRYIGLTCAPAKSILLQHLNAARLWLPGCITVSGSSRPSCDRCIAGSERFILMRDGSRLWSLRRGRRH